MAAAEGEKKGAMEAEKVEKEAMAAEKGAPVEEKGKGEEGAVEEEEKGEAATEKGKGMAEAEEVVGVEMIVVKSLDGEKRCLSVAAAELSVALRHLIEDGCANGVIPLKNVATGRTLDTMIEYCTKHADDPVKFDCDPSASAGSSSSVGAVNTTASKDLEEWDRKLVEGLSADDLYDLLIAANYLVIKGLLDVVFQKAADMIMGKTTKQIRETFNLPNDLTKDDVVGLRQQYAWAFDERHDE